MARKKGQGEKGTGGRGDKGTGGQGDEIVRLAPQQIIAFSEEDVPQRMDSGLADDEVEQVSPVQEMEEELFEMGSWHGMPQWKCRLCPWDTLKGEAAMREHLATVHGPPARPKGAVLVADKYGREVEG